MENYFIMKNKDEELIREGNPILTDKPIWIDYGDGLGEFLDVKKLRFDENTIEGVNNSKAIN